MNLSAMNLQTGYDSLSTRPDPSKLTIAALTAAMSGDERKAFSEYEPFALEYLAAGEHMAKAGTSLSEYVRSGLHDKQGVWPSGDAAFGAHRVGMNSVLDSALAKAETVVRGYFPLLSATGMYRD